MKGKREGKERRRGWEQTKDKRTDCARWTAARRSDGRCRHFGRADCARVALIPDPDRINRYGGNYCVLGRSSVGLAFFFVSFFSSRFLLLSPCRFAMCRSTDLLLHHTHIHTQTYREKKGTRFYCKLWYMVDG